MKKFYLIILLILSGVANANDIDQLNEKLAEIETKFDICLSTKDEKICEDVVIENPILEILGNETFGKLLSSSACEIGTKCGAATARITSKTLKVSNFLIGQN